MKRVLVTGGAGFLGARLCGILLERGHDVMCLDNLSTGSKRNVEEYMSNPYFELIRHDVTDPIHLEVDEIYNLACPASPKHYQRDPVQTVRTNVQGAINVLDLARFTGARVVQASTSEVYGDPAVHPQPETYRGNVNPIGRRACYDEGKRCAETLFFDYHREYQVNIGVVRIFNTYGPGMAIGDGRVVSNFIVNALRGDPLQIHGSGDQTRSFCYVDDTLYGLLRMMDKENVYTGPYNIGNTEEVTIAQLAREVIELTVSTSRITRIGSVADDPTRRRPNTDEAYKDLGWVGVTPRRHGLIQTIAYFKDRLAEL